MPQQQLQTQSTRTSAAIRLWMEKATVSHPCRSNPSNAHKPARVRIECSPSWARDVHAYMLLHNSGAKGEATVRAQNAVAIGKTAESALQRKPYVSPSASGTVAVTTYGSSWMDWNRLFYPRCTYTNNMRAWQTRTQQLHTHTRIQLKSYDFAGRCDGPCLTNVTFYTAFIWLPANLTEIMLAECATAQFALYTTTTIIATAGRMALEMWKIHSMRIAEDRYHLVFGDFACSVHHIPMGIVFRMSLTVYVAMWVGS